MVCLLLMWVENGCFLNNTLGLCRWLRYNMTNVLLFWECHNSTRCWKIFSYFPQLGQALWFRVPFVMWLQDSNYQYLFGSVCTMSYVGTLTTEFSLKEIKPSGLKINNVPCYFCSHRKHNWLSRASPHVASRLINLTSHGLKNSMESFAFSWNYLLSQLLMSPSQHRQWNCWLYE